MGEEQTIANLLIGAVLICRWLAITQGTSHEMSFEKRGPSAHELSFEKRGPSAHELSFKKWSTGIKS